MFHTLKSLRITIFFIPVLLLPSTQVFAVAPADKTKAAYIFQFTKFIEWPKSEEFTICILESDSIITQLQLLKNQQSEKQNIVIKSINDKFNITECKILYIGISAEPKLSNIIKILQYHPVLTVSSIPDFINKGGMINFVVENNKVRFKINLNSTREADLKISAKLLEISLKVIKHSAGGSDL